MERYYILIEKDDGEMMSVARYNSIDDLTKELSRPFYENQKWHILVEVDDRIWEFNKYQEKKDYTVIIAFAVFMIITIAMIIIECYLKF